MLKAAYLSLTLVVTGLLIFGCSDNGADTATTPNITDNTANSINHDSQRMLWGVWNIQFDPAEMTASINPIRSCHAHYNITDMVTPPACNDCLEIAVNSFDPVTRIMDVDVTLRNPYQIAGYDVRGILYTNDYGHELRNADDWTKLWDIPSGGTINPFKAFAKGKVLREFAGEEEHTENYRVYIPKPPAYFAITFAVDASWPGNCKEPYEISNFGQDTICDETGSTGNIYIDIYDWQNDVDKVTLVAPEITGEDFTPFTHLFGSSWSLELTNNTGAEAGDYEVRLIATSANSGDIALYDFVTITISETGAPSITAIDPEEAEAGSDLTEVTITGLNFLAPAEVKLSKELAADIVATNVVVVDPETITCDIDIPLNSDIGLYDVVVTNGDAKVGKGLQMFEVVGPTPTVTGIDPEEEAAGHDLEEVTITGTKFLSPAEVKLTKASSPDIVATNVVVVDPQTITCDINIPFEADLGLYDVVVTNFGGKIGMGVQMFEVLCPTPLVAGIDPDSVEAGNDLIDVEISGNKFWGPGAQVKLEMAGEPDIVATNVEVVTPAAITCDISIPINAEPGLYDVTVINGCGTESIGGTELFEVTVKYGWARTWGGFNSDFGRGVAVDDYGNVYVTGHFRGTVDFDPGPDMDEHTSNGGWDVFMGKFDSNGDFQWARTWGGTGIEYLADYGFGVTVDDWGNVYVIGSFWLTVDFDPGPGIDNHTSSDRSDVFLSKFDSNGNFQWARTWGGFNSDFGRGVAVDGSGDVYVTGEFCGPVDFDPGPGIDEHTSAWWSRDPFLSKFDSNGDFQWARTWGGGGNYDNGNGVAVDDSGNVYVTGDFEGTVDFDPGPGTDNHTADGDYTDAFLSKFDSGGDFQWARTWGGGFYGDRGRGVALDDSGNVYITGLFSSTVDFDPGAGMDEHISNGSGDIFLSKFDSNGDFQWARTWGGEDSDRGNVVAVDDSGNVYITGRFASTADFDPGPGVDEHVSNGDIDVFLSKFSSNGDFQWARTWGGEDSDCGWGVAVYDSGNVYVVGYFRETVDFDPGPGTDEHTSTGNADAFLSKFPPDGNW